MSLWWMRGVVLCLLLLASPGIPCETGVAHVQSTLSVPRSLLANADVAVLHTYAAPSLARCMEQCCSQTYGSCSIASFQKNTTKDNCVHFYCRPLSKCRFTSSNSTDTFSFSSELPIRHTTSASTTGSTTKEEIATFASEEQFANKNDNTTVKPRKGVEEGPLEDQTNYKSSVKPRKGVSTQDIPHSELIPGSLNKSNVKARKGVGPSPNVSSPSPTPSVEDKDLISALQKAFEDEPQSIQPSSTTYLPSTSSVTGFVAVSTTSTGLLSSMATPYVSVVSATSTMQLRHFVSSAVEELIFSPSSSMATPVISVTKTYVPSTRTQGVIEQDGNTEHKIVSSSSQESFPERLVADEEEETETDRKYKSSIHLVLSLVFGLLVLFAVLGVVAKRVYDGWLRRDYYRMNYLIDGIYNGVD